MTGRTWQARRRTCGGGERELVLVRELARESVYHTPEYSVQPRAVHISQYMYMYLPWMVLLGSVVRHVDMNLARHA